MAESDDSRSPKRGKKRARRAGGNASPNDEITGAPPAEPDDEGREIPMGRMAVPPALNDPDRRREWKLPEGEEEPGPYMVELNLQHREGLPGAEHGFLELYRQVVPDLTRGPVRVGKTYFSCYISVREWRALVKEDERNPPKERTIYRIWPDFPIKATMDRSIATIKADAAFRAFSASGAGIVWAVIDSGVDASHPHFGDPPEERGKEGFHHTLLEDDVADLHRDFRKQDDGRLVLPDPDLETDLEAEERKTLIDLHVKSALSDDFGHGTHVAGVIAGGLPSNPRDGAIDFRVFGRKFESAGEGKRAIRETVEERSSGADPAQFRGVAPRCKLISIRVLDEKGQGRASQIMRALEYVRELNGDPKLLRIHGVNLSVGYEFDAELFACGQSPLCIEVDRLVQTGVAVVAAAGNTGYGTLTALKNKLTRVGLSNTINDPGNAQMAITVGATHRDSPHTYGVSYFSSKGPTGDGRLKPDVVAPGERITSCAAGRNLQHINEQLAAQGKPPIPDGPPPAAAAGGSPPLRSAAYLDDSGTSMAAPHVSGAIAAFLSIRREFIGKPWDIKRIFLESATSLGRERYFEGHGLLDLMRAIQSV